jgi:hypothetical protein
MNYRCYAFLGFFVLTIFVILLLLLRNLNLKSKNECVNQNVVEGKSDTSWRGFSHVRSIPIQGTEEHPVYNIKNLAVQDSLIVILERKSATLTAFNLEGGFQYQVGGPGRGPGQFTNPYWVGFDVGGRIAVLEGPANNRFQFIDPGNGKSLDVLTEDVLVTPECDHVYFYENESGDHRAVFSTQVSCTSSSGGLCTIHKYDINSRKSVKRFARKDKVDKNALGDPWILGYDGDERLYISHVHGVMFLFIT